MNREKIYCALFNLVCSVSGFTTVSRRLKPWSEVEASQQPALFQAQVSENVVQVTNQPPKWKMEVNLYIYCYSSDPKISPSIQINNLLDAIEDVLKPNGALENQTLGGLVTYCRISGKTQTDEGVLGQQAVVIIPIEILIPN